MKHLLYKQINNYLFYGKKGTAALEYCLRQYGKCFIAMRGVGKTPQKVLKNSVINSKKQETFHVEKMFSSKAQSNNVLMNFDVWLYPKISCSIRFFYNLNVVVNSLDDNFSVDEFSESSLKALEVVTILLSKLRFKELEDLLTPECKQEVEKNIQNWSEPWLNALNINFEINTLSTPCDIIVFPDENNDAKKFVEVRVIHYVWLPYSPKCNWKEVNDCNIALSEQNNSRNVYVCGVFNTKFIREYYQDVSSQWKMNAINLKIFPEIKISYN